MQKLHTCNPPMMRSKKKGRIAKRLKELVLLDQPYIKDSALTVEQLVKQTAGKRGRQRLASSPEYRN